jgi:hypothetical protein
MFGQAIGCLDSRLYCLVTRPLATLLAGGVGGGIFGAWGGVAYGALNGSSSFVIEGGLRGALAGAIAGFIAGLMSVIDRMTWPKSAQEEWELRTANAAGDAPAAVEDLSQSFRIST